jgi:Protein of unknown function (DUF3307)
MIAIVPLIAVYVAFAAKQLLADYYFQTEWMVFGKGSKDGWFAPLATHAGVHAALTLAIVLVVRPSLWWLAVADFVIHVAIDRGKAMVSRRLALTPKDTGFWWAIGTDQTLHQLTHFAYVILLVRPM